MPSSFVFVRIERIPVTFLQRTLLKLQLHFFAISFKPNFCVSHLLYISFPPQTAMHPANVIKTLLQMKGSFEAIQPLTRHVLARGAGAQFLLSLPSGAIHFIVLEVCEK